MDNPNPNEPPLPAQNNNQSLENQVASLTQQVALLTQLLLQQQANQQAFNNPGPTSSPIIQSEQRSPVNETNLERICKECKDNQKPLYKHFEWCKQCYNRLTTKKRRDEFQNDQDRFVNYCHQAAEIPRRVRRSMEERQNTEVDQAKLEAQHRQAVTSGEEDNNDELDESGEEQKYPMIAEKFNSSSTSQERSASPLVISNRRRKPLNPNIRREPMTKEEFERAFPDGEPTPKYDQSGQEICLTCGTKGIMSMHRCSICYSRHKEAKYRADPGNYRKCRVCKNDKAWHRGEFAKECSTCYQRLHRNFILSKIPRFNSIETSKRPRKPKNNDSVKHSVVKHVTAKSVSRSSNGFILRKTPMTPEEFARSFPDTPLEPRFNNNGVEVCIDCESTQIMASHRCSTCYNRNWAQYRRSNPANYYKCRVCNLIAYHQTEIHGKCHKCYMLNYQKQTGKKTVRTIFPKRKRPAITQFLNRSLNTSKQSLNTPNKPLSSEEFQRRYVDQQIDPFITPSGQHLCGDCHVNQIEKLNRCITCYNKFAEERRRNNPDFYCYCGQCREYFYFKILYMKSKRCQQCNTPFQKNLPVDEQDLHEDPINLDEQTLSEKPLVMPKRESCNKFRLGWARIRRQIIMKRFYLNAAERLRIKRKEDRQKRREERQRDNIVVPPNAKYWKPKGWRKGQCKVCRIKLSGSIRHHVNVNFCKGCSEKYLNQRICTKCGQKKQHHGKGMCFKCYSDMKYRKKSFHPSTAQASHAKVESQQINGNFLMNTAQNVSKQTATSSSTFHFEEPVVIDLTMSDDE